MSNEQSKSDQVYETLKDLEVLDLVSKKTSAIKELDKMIKQTSAVDVSKNSERVKLTKLLEKVNDSVLVISTIDRLLKEKDF